MVPIMASGFIYIALSDLIPELHKEENISHSTIQFIFMLFGIALMFVLLLLS
jgi:zinc transporter ZupT